MNNAHLKNLTFLTVGLAMGAAISLFMACDSPPVNCDTDYQCSQTPPCMAKQLDYERGVSEVGCDGTPWTEPYYYVGHKCNFRGQSYYSDDRKMLQSRCMWVHRA